MKIEMIKELEEFKKYKSAQQDLKDVSKGGKDWAACSFMDISVRIDRLEAAKVKLILALGEREFDKIQG